MNVRTMPLVSIFTACLLISASGAWAANGTWSGADNGLWTNSLNWSASPFPSGGDTATFSADSANRTVDIAGLSGILTIVFDSASVPAYTIGAGAANSQTAILRDGGEIRLSATAASDQTFSARVRLGPDNANAAYSLRNDSTTKTLTFNDIAGMSGGTKTLNFNGVGPFTVNGILDRSSSTFDLVMNASSTLSLNGNTSARQFFVYGTNAVINIASGKTLTLTNAGGNGFMATENFTINGPGSLLFSTAGGNNHLDHGVSTNKTATINAKITGATGFEFWQNAPFTGGTYLLANTANDYTLSTVINVPGTVAFPSIANRGVASCLGAGTNLVLNHAAAVFKYTGTGDTTDRTVDLQAGGAIEQAGSGLLKFTTNITATASAKPLVLQGSTAGQGEFSGAIINSLGTISLTKDGTGTWSLSASNTYSGVTLVNNGILSLTGTFGSIRHTGAITVTGSGTLKLNSSASENNTDRLANATPLTLANGTLSFTHDGGAANFEESVGTVTLAAGANVISASQAADTQTSALRLAGLVRNGSATVNFTGTGLGASDRNRIFIAGLADGPLGSWATVNGTSYAAYSSAQGIYAFGTLSEVEIAARAPSQIPDNENAEVRITTAGVDGAITLQGEYTNTVFSLSQETNVAAVVRTRDGLTDKVFKSTAIQISAGQADLTLGEASGDGAVAAAGAFLSLVNNEPSATLTLNAPVVNNGSALTGISKFGPGTVRLTGLNTYSGQTALVEGSLIFANNSATQSLAGVVSGNGALIKQGSGVLGLAGANTYTGLTTISAGTLRVQNNFALGAQTEGTVIEDGATLDVAGLTNGFAISLNAEQITVRGAGVAGRGAIVNTFNSPQYSALRLVTLAGDTTFGGEQSNARWDIRNTGGTSTFLMNGYTLSKVGANSFGLTGVGVTPGATGAIDVKEGWFTLEVGTTLGGDAANTLTQRSGTVLDLYDLYAPVPWSLILEDNTRVYARNGNATNRNIWSGPVTLNGRTVFDAYGTFSDTISGPISGAGSVVKTTANSTTYFTNPGNTYAGTTAVSNGTLVAAYAGSLPGYNAAGKVTVLGGANLTVRTGDGTTGWNKTQLGDLLANATFTANTAVLGVEAAQSDLTYDRDLSQALSLVKSGNYTLTLTGTNSYTGTTRVNGGTLTFPAGSSNSIGAITLAGGAAGATLKLQGETTQLGNTTLYGGTVAGDRSMLYLSTNVNVYAYNLSTVANGNTAVYQTGGENTCRYWLGIGANTAGSYAYYSLTGGSLSVATYFEVGVYGHGVMEVFGGTVNPGSGSTFVLARRTGVSSVLNVFGGLVNAPAGGNSIQMGASDYWGPNAKLNIVGPGVVNAAFGTGTTKILELYTGNGSGGSGIVTLKDGGTLIANRVAASRSGVTLLNFDKGTLRASPSTTVGATFLQGLAGAVVYPGGAIIDTTNTGIRINQPLLAPTGYGVTAIPLRSNGAGYIGAPAVNITGGSGTGATAIATVDLAEGSPTRGQLTGLTITSPGFGYLATDKPTVTLVGGGATAAAVTNSCALALNSAAGGLTKLGSGTLTLGGTNTYGGATTVSNGTLRLAVAHALPANTALRLHGGSLDLGGFTVTNTTVSLTSGEIFGGRIVCSGLSKSGSGTASLGAVIPEGTVEVQEGVLRLTGDRPGLYEGLITGNAFDITTPNPMTAITNGTVMANLTTWPVTTATYAYSGYIWNRTGTNAVWSFAEQFDDNVRVTIDGTVVLSNMTWNAVTVGSVTLTPGPHRLEARFGQGTGGVGPNNGWSIGFGYDPFGRGTTTPGNYRPVTDPGDGSLLTLTAETGASDDLLAAAAVSVSAAATLDLGGTVRTLGSLGGSGTVSNGTLVANGSLAPGGEGTVGTLTLASGTTLSGTLLIDVAAGGASDRIDVRGNLTFAPGATLEVANPGLLDRRKQYTVATCSGTRTGTLTSVSAGDPRWHAVYLADGTVKLVFLNGTMIQIR